MIVEMKRSCGNRIRLPLLKYKQKVSAGNWHKNKYHSYRRKSKTKGGIRVRIRAVESLRTPA